MAGVPFLGPAEFDLLDSFLAFQQNSYCERDLSVLRYLRGEQGEGLEGHSCHYDV